MTDRRFELHVQLVYETHFILLGNSLTKAMKGSPYQEAMGALLKVFPKWSELPPAMQQVWRDTVRETFGTATFNEEALEALLSVRPEDPPGMPRHG